MKVGMNSRFSSQLVDGAAGVRSVSQHFEG